jgi:hypothetical protein
MPRRIHLATVHWRSNQWIDIQIDAMHRFLGRDINLYAYLNQVEEKHHEHFCFVRTEDNLNHAQKLNKLAEHILGCADPEDILIFIDGDAFPVGELHQTLDELEQYPLIAVKRAENNGDQQPHPCFCCTTAGFWRDIQGDWQGGGYWNNAQGQPITDVGGLLLNKLEAGGIAWKPLLRSNRKNLHPLWFGVYGDVIYHHGGGFRDKLSRLDAQNGMNRLSSTLLSLQRKLQIGKRAPALNKKIVTRIHNYMREKNTQTADAVYQAILQDPDFCTSLGFLPSMNRGVV